MSFDIKCQHRDGILITYAYVGICLPGLSANEDCARLECRTPLACLFDTGASFTFVDRAFLKSIHAEPIPQTNEFQTGNGIVLSEQYRVAICLPNHTLIPNIIVNASNTTFGVTIGMDIINCGELTLYHKNDKSYIRFLMD